jgi:hypothetical protein
MWNMEPCSYAIRGGPFMAHQFELTGVTTPAANSDHAADAGGHSTAAAGQNLWRLYEALPHHDKTIMRLNALVGPVIGKSPFLDVIRLSGIRPPGPRGWSFALLNTHLDALQHKRLLDRTFACAPEVLHIIAADAAICDDAERLLKSVKDTIPHSSREHRTPYSSYYHRVSLPDDIDLLRRVRLAVYANDEAEFIRLRDIIHAEEKAAGALLSAFLISIPAYDVPWFEQRRPAIREALAESFLRTLLNFGVMRAGDTAFIEYCASMPPIRTDAGKRITKLLLRHDMLSAKFEQARRRMAMLAPEDAHLVTGHEAVIAFLTGQSEAAIAGFGEALKQFRKSAGKRKVVLEDETGVFHTLALLRAGDAALHTEIRSLIDNSNSEFHLNPLHSAYRAVGALLDLVAGREAQARKAVEGLPDTIANPVAGAVVALAGLFIDAGTARVCVKQREADVQRLAAILPLAARIHAEILGVIAKDGAHWRERTAALGGPDIIGFTQIVSIKPAWERAFDTLTTFLKPDEPKRAAAKAPAQKKRLAWFADMATQQVEAAEQSFKGRAWSTGRPIALKRLHERDARLDYFSEDDRRVLKCLRKEKTFYSGGLYYFDEYRTLPALVGHPHVFDSAHRDRQIELVAYPVELVVKETAKGYTFHLSHHADAPAIFLEEETPARWRVIELTAKLLELQATLGKNGLTVPREMRDRVTALLREGNPAVPIRSELTDADVPAREGDATPVLQLQRLGDGLKINLVVRPFGARGPFYMAGQGGRSVLAMCEGARQRVNRDLDAEKAAAQALIAACPGLQAWRAGEHEWQVEALKMRWKFWRKCKVTPSR